MNSSDAWILHVDARVAKETRRFPKKDFGAIKDAIRLLPQDPHAGDIQKMRGEDDTWRRRIGSHRIFFRIKAAERIILVFHVERRTSTTY